MLRTGGTVQIRNCGSREWTSGNRRSGHELRGCERRSVTVAAYQALPNRLIAPDGAGDINNYTVIYVTNNQDLAIRFQIAGLPAVFDPQLACEYTSDTTGDSGELYVSSGGEELSPYFFFGTETEPPPNSGQTFLANWWFTGPEGRMKQSTLFPIISFGTAAVFLYKSNVSLLGKLIGGNADGDFSILSVRGVYSAVTMTVSLNRQH